MSGQKRDPETQFGRVAWSVLAVCIALFVYGNLDLFYRYSQPTDGLLLGDAGNASVLRNLTGANPELRVGDTIVSIEGVPVDFTAFFQSDLLKTRWQAGATLDYEVAREGDSIIVPVTLGHWPSGAAFVWEVMGPQKVFALVISLLQIFLALFVLLRQPGNPTAGAFLLLMYASTYGDFSGVVPFGYGAWIRPLGGFAPSTLDVLLYGSIFPASLTWFAMTFPHPKPIYRRLPWLPVAAGLSGIALEVLAPGTAWFWFVFSLFLAVGTLIHSAVTMRDPASRAQIRWGIGGLVIFYGPASVALLLSTLGIINFSDGGIGLSLLFPVLALIMVTMLAVGILRYRLFDIDLIIRRTLQYTVLTALLALLYFGGVTILQAVFSGVLHESDLPLVTVITTLLIAALFNPLRGRIQRWIDRRFYRSKYDAEETLAGFAEVARDEVDIDRLTSSMMSVVQHAMQPECVSLWLKAE